MLNLHTKHIVLSHDFIRLLKLQKVRIKKINIKSDTYILQNEDKSYNWDHIKLILSRMKSILKT